MLIPLYREEAFYYYKDKRLHKYNNKGDKIESKLSFPITSMSSNHKGFWRVDEAGVLYLEDELYFENILKVEGNYALTLEGNLICLMFNEVIAKSVSDFSMITSNGAMVCNLFNGKTVLRTRGLTTEVFPGTYNRKVFVHQRELIPATCYHNRAIGQANGNVILNNETILTFKHPVLSVAHEYNLVMACDKYDLQFYCY